MATIVERGEQAVVSTIEAVNVAVHVTAGCLGLGLGLFPLLAPKGGPLHRRTGRLFAIVAGAALVCAVIGDVFFGSPMPLVAATLSVAYQLISGLRALACRQSGPKIIDGLFAVVALAGCGTLLIAMGPGSPSWSPAVGYSTLGYVACVALYDLSRHGWTNVWRHAAWPLDHGLKMTGAYFGMMSAGAGNLLRNLHPWSQIGPSIIGVVVMAAIAVHWTIRGRRQFRAEPPR